MISKGQTRMISEFSSSFSIAWLAASLIASSVSSYPITITQMSIGLLNSIGAFVISFVLARKI